MPATLPKFFLIGVPLEDEDNTVVSKKANALLSSPET
jgi:hypothetical protein